MTASPYNTTQREVLAALESQGLGAKGISFLERFVKDAMVTGGFPVRMVRALSEFGNPTDENTITWGASADLSFLAPAIGEGIVTSTQLLEVSRSRPTTFTLLTLVQLGSGWTNDSNLTINITYFLGIGTTRVPVQRQILVATPIDNAQFVDVSTFPAQAVHGQVQIIDATIVNTGIEHFATAYQLAAPVVQ